MPSGEVVATPDWVMPFKVILYNDDGSVIGETPVQTEAEGEAFITSTLVEALETDQDGTTAPSDHP